MVKDKAKRKRLLEDLKDYFVMVKSTRKTRNSKKTKDALKRPDWIHLSSFDLPPTLVLSKSNKRNRRKVAEHIYDVREDLQSKGKGFSPGVLGNVLAYLVGSNKVLLEKGNSGFVSSV